MAASMNKVLLLGEIAGDFELKQVGERNTSMCVLRLKTERQWTPKGQAPKSDTTYIDVKLWGHTAEQAHQQAPAGSLVHIEGRLSPESWEDRQTGQKRWKLVVTGETVQVVTVPPAAAPRTPPPARETAPVRTPPPNDEIPF